MSGGREEVLDVGCWMADVRWERRVAGCRMMDAGCQVGEKRCWRLWDEKTED
jgi:hypothetical protein